MTEQSKAEQVRALREARHARRLELARARTARLRKKPKKRKLIPYAGKDKGGGNYEDSYGKSATRGIKRKTKLAEEYDKW